MPLPAGCSTPALCSPLSPLQVSPRLQGGTTEPVLQAQTSLDSLLVMLLPPSDTWGKSLGP